MPLLGAIGAGSVRGFGFGYVAGGGGGGGGGGGVPVDPPETLSDNVSYTSVGTDTFIVPTDVYWIKVEATGAGGGKGVGTGNGGAGGYIEGWLAVTPGQSFTVVVGGGGKGKGPSATARYGAGGGGFSGLIDDATGQHWISAGGGGGGQTNAPIVSSGVATVSGGHTTVYESTSAAGGPGGEGNSTASTLDQLDGASGSSSGGGNGGTTWTGSTTLDAGGGGGGGGYGTTAGLGGLGNNGSNATINTTGQGGDGGFGGGGGGGGGGFGGTAQRTNPGSGGGGGYIGGKGGENNTVNLHRSGQGGWNFLKHETNPRGGSVTPLITSTSGGGAAGATVSGANGSDGLVILSYQASAPTVSYQFFIGDSGAYWFRDASSNDPAKALGFSLVFES